MIKKSLIALAAISLFFNSTLSQERELVEGVIAQINSEIITHSQFNERYEEIELVMMSRLPADQIEEAKQLLRKQVFNDLINELLIKQRARERGVRFTEESFRQQVEWMKQQIGARTDDEFRQALSEQGMTLEEYRDFVEKDYYLRGLFSVEVGRDLYQSESRVQNFYEENIKRYTQPAKVRLAQISFPFTSVEKEEAGRQAEAALARLRNGEDFGQVYRDVTPDAAPDSSGDIGTLELTAMRAEMADEVKKIAEGETTGVIELPGSYIILKLTELVPEAVVPLEQIKERVLNDMQAATLQREMRKYIQRIKKQSYIKVLDESFAGLYDESYFQGESERVGNR